MKGYMLNGEFHRGERLTIDLRAPFFAHGAGLFETLRTHRGRPILLGPHVDRLVTAARRLGLDCPLDGDEAARQVAALLEQTGLEEARVKMFLLVRGDGRSDFLVTAEEIEPLCVLSRSIDVDRAAEPFNGATALPGLKTMNYMVNRLAEEEGRRRGLGEVLFTLPDDTVTEGTRSTVFMVEGGVLRTPPLELPILPGVTRQALLGVARRLGVSAREEAFTFARLQDAEEAFVAGSVGGIRPIRSVGFLALPAAPGPVTRRLAEAYQEMIEHEENDAGTRPDVLDSGV